MSLNSQAILPGHLTVQEVCELLEVSCDAKNLDAQEMYRPEHWLIGFSNADGCKLAMDVFLNSWAADDYVDAMAGQTTLVTVPLGPGSEEVVRALSVTAGGRYRRHEGEPWE